jgi:hypothetical protein
MKDNGGHPLIGSVAMALGMRPAQGERPADIPVDATGRVHPLTGGMSVYASLKAMPARMVPKRLRAIIPDAAGSNNLRVWSMGTGAFVSSPQAPSLSLRIDPEDPLHGLVEPDAIMYFEHYELALISTHLSWAVAED